MTKLVRQIGYCIKVKGYQTTIADNALALDALMLDLFTEKCESILRSVLNVPWQEGK